MLKEEGKMDWSWLLVLVCPLMMIFMMFGMKGHGHVHGRGDHAHHSPNEQAIRAELDELKAQNEQIKQALQKLSR